MPSAKKYLVGLTSAALVLGTVATGVTAMAATPQTSPPFSDIAGSPDEAAITFLYALGAVTGVGNGLFDPTAPVTRAEFAKIVVNLLGLGNVATALANETPPFKDAKQIPTWAWGYVNVAADDGIVVGYPNHTFGPNNDVTDAEAATMLIRAIGDTSQVTNATSSSAWPGNYVAAAFQLGLTEGVNFVANIPATRGDLAQMAYNAAVSVPVYAPVQGSSPLVYEPKEPLYEGGASTNFTGINGFKAIAGVVTSVNLSSITVGGTSYSWASQFDLVGASNVGQLQNGNVLLLENGSGQIVFAQLLTGASSAQGWTLATSSTQVPAGYYQVNSSWPWIVTSNYACVNGGTLTQSNGCGSQYSLLISSSSGTKTVPLATYWSETAGTVFEVNPSSDGSQLGTVPDVTYFSAGDPVSYTVNSSGQATVVAETNATYQIGIITSTYCQSGCDSSQGWSPLSVPQITFTIAQVSSAPAGCSLAGTTATCKVNIQPYTTVEVNGQAAQVSSALDGDVVYVDAVGNGLQGSLQAVNNSSTATPNATLVSAVKNQVNGTLQGFTQTNGTVNTLTISGSSGTVTYSADSNFQTSTSTLESALGTPVTVTLDSQGQAAAVTTTVPSAVYLAAVVTGSGSQEEFVNGTTQTVNTLIVSDVNGSNQSVTLAQGVTNPAGTFSSTTGSGGTVVLYQQAGVVQAVYGMQPVQPVPGDHWAVQEATSSYVVLAQENSSDNVDFTGTNGNPYLTIPATVTLSTGQTVDNVAVGSSGEEVSFSSLGGNVSVYQYAFGTSGSAYVVVEQSG